MTLDGKGPIVASKLFRTNYIRLGRRRTNYIGLCGRHLWVCLAFVAEWLRSLLKWKDAGSAPARRRLRRQNAVGLTG